MTRHIAVVALALVGCSGATADLADANSDRLEKLEKDLAALETRLEANEAAAATNATELARVGAESANAARGAAENADAIGALGVRVDGHDLALSQEGAALAGLEARLFDPVYGEIPALHAESAVVASGLVTQGAELAAVRSTVSGNSTAIAGLAATVSGFEGALADNALMAATNAADIDGLRSDVDANTADLVAVTNLAEATEAAVIGLQARANQLQAAVDGLETDVASNTAAIGVNAADIAAIEASYVTAADLVPLESDIAANTADIAANRADIAAIQTNYLGELDDLFSYLSTDTTTDTLLLAGADLQVDGRVLSDTIQMRQCTGGRYRCTPKACLALCQANGERMATTDEILAWASAGNDSCGWAWMLDRNNPTVPVRAYPMYSNRTTTGCGAQGTGDVPRFGNGVINGVSWDDPGLFDCACSAE